MSENNPVKDTVVTVDSIAPDGLTLIKFSNALKEPLQEDDYPDFKDTPGAFFNITYKSNYELFD